jgi:type VI protein secretion system component Hcp
MEYRTLLSPFYVRIHRLENWIQEIAVNDIIYPQKSLSLSPIGHSHAYKMHDMTIHKQFDAL